MLPNPKDCEIGKGEAEALPPFVRMKSSCSPLTGDFPALLKVSPILRQTDLASLWLLLSLVGLSTRGCSRIDAKISQSQWSKQLIEIRIP